MKKVLITTVPFGNIDATPLRLLGEAGINFEVNPLRKKLTEDELADMVTDYDGIIAGTEPITDKVMSKASKLKLIFLKNSVSIISSFYHLIKNLHLCRRKTLLWTCYLKN